MAYDLIKISALPETTPDESQDIVIGEGDYAKRINYGDVKADMVGTEPLYTTDTEPYLMRQTAHFGVVGKCALNKLVGGSLGWNQLCNGSSVTVPNGHKYYMKKSGTASIGASTGSAITGLTSGTDMVIDLTAELGSTIADYIYSLESATAGAGVAWLSQYIDLSTYHAYDAGSIQSVQATEHVTLSKNFLTDYEGHGTTYTISGVTFTQNPDGTITLNGTATAAVTYYLAVRQRNFYLPKGSYILSGTPTGYIQYTLRLGINRGADGATVGNDLGSGFAFTEATGETYGVWIAFDSGAVFNNVVMKPMIRYASADSTYVPYEKHIYPLGSDTLRGIPQLVSNKLQFDGDEKYPDGTIKRQYGSRAYQSGDTSDGATMITDGTTTVYKLTTPTTESSTSFQKVQTIDADGTESFTTSSPVPVGHETQTADNVLAALGWLGE